MQLLILKSRETHPRGAPLSPKLDLVSLWAERHIRSADSLSLGFLSADMPHCMSKLHIDFWVTLWDLGLREPEELC